MAANSTTARSGTAGKAVVDSTLVLRLTQWSITPASSVDEWGDTDSNGFQNTKEARKSATLSLAGKFDTGRKIYTLFQAGDNIEVILWEDASDYWAFPCAVCTSYNETVDPDTKEVIAWTADFTADGVYYYPGEAGAPAETLPAS